MRNFSRFFLIGVLLICPFFAYSQTMVRDKNVNNQLKSIEFMQWKFTPEYYYYSWYTDVVWPGIPISIPGMGLHQQYINDYERNIFQETPAIVATTLTKNEAEKQKNSTEKVYNSSLKMYMDASIDVQYQLMKPRFDELYSNINMVLKEYAKERGDPMHVIKLADEKGRIEANVNIIKNSHLGSAKKREAYLGFQDELSTCLALATRLRNLNRRIK